MQESAFPDTGRSDNRNFFAGGDITPGEGDVITAIADGLRAVQGIIDRLE
jgi:NADPH-dependent glutamate synthase beta subunit-like oxidoreductase